MDINNNHAVLVGAGIEELEADLAQYLPVEKGLEELEGSEVDPSMELTGINLLGPVGIERKMMAELIDHLMHDVVQDNNKMFGSEELKERSG